MSPDNALKLVTLGAIALGLLLPALIAFLLLRYMTGPGPIPYLGAVLGMLLGAYVVFFHLFPDTFRGSSGPKVTIEVILPDRYQGFVYLYFDSQQAPLQPSGKNVYSLLVPSTGRLWAGRYPGQEVGADNASYYFRYLNGERPQVAAGSLTGGGQSHNGLTVNYVRPFIGSDADFENRQKAGLAANTWFDELEVLEEFRRAAKAPAPTRTPASLEGIEGIPKR